MSRLDRILYLGSTWFIDGVALDRFGRPLDMTGGTVEFRLVGPSGLLLTLTSPSDVSIASGVTGAFTITLAATDARQTSLSPALLSYEIDAITAAGVVSVQTTGKIMLSESLRAIYPRYIAGSMVGGVPSLSTLTARLTHSLKGSVASAVLLSGALTLRRALAGGIAANASLSGRLTSALGVLSGAIPHSGALTGRLTNSLKGSVSASPAVAGGLSLKKALSGSVTGGAVLGGNLTTTASGSRLLLANGSSFALQTNATDKILLMASVAGFTLLGGAALTMLDGSTFSLLA